MKDIRTYFQNRIALLLLLSSGLGIVGTGCAEIQIHRYKDPPEDRKGSWIQMHQEVLFFETLRIDDPIEIASHCRYGWETIATYKPGEALLYAIFFLNQVSSWEIEIQCSRYPVR